MPIHKACVSLLVMADGDAVASIKRWGSANDHSAVINDCALAIPALVLVVGSLFFLAQNLVGGPLHGTELIGMETPVIHDAGQSRALAGGAQPVARNRVTIKVRARIRANRNRLAYPFAVVPVHRTAKQIRIDPAQAKCNR